MPYVDQEYYMNAYQGLHVSPDNFKRYAKRASEDIDQLTRYRITDIDKVHVFIQEQVKKAVCAQIEFYEHNGGYDAMKESGAMGNVSIGSFSYGGGTSSDSKSKRTDLSDSVIGYLKPTGLLYSGIGVINGY